MTPNEECREWLAELADLGARIERHQNAGELSVTEEALVELRDAVVYVRRAMWRMKLETVERRKR